MYVCMYVVRNVYVHLVPWSINVNNRVGILATVHSKVLIVYTVAEIRTHNLYVLEATRTVCRYLFKVDIIRRCGQLFITYIDCLKIED
jgi:hypothetical protein